MRGAGRSGDGLQMVGRVSYSFKVWTVRMGEAGLQRVSVGGAGRSGDGLQMVSRVIAIVSRCGLYGWERLGCKGLVWEGLGGQGLGCE